VSHVIGFVRFWYDFIVGDDAWLAAGVVTAIALTALLGAWWVMVVAVIAVLLVSVARAAR
jgi:hypothetical protein